MARCGRRGGSCEGFTLLEVVLATVILATAATTIVTIYIHSIKQATSSRDLAYATSYARNAIEEGLGHLSASESSGDIPGRETLTVNYIEEAAGEEMLFDTLTATVTEDSGRSKVAEFVMKRAVYIQPEEEETGATDE
mgnify:CR=1 FL=1